MKTSENLPVKATDELDVNLIRQDFPVLQQQSNGYPLAYLDNAASAQKPRQVIEAIDRFYSEYYSNIHRGVYDLSIRASEAYDEARATIARFINARHEHEVIFTSGTTDSINLVAYSFSNLLNPGDEILISRMEHHSNIVPWQLISQRTGAKIQVIPIDENGLIQWDDFEKLINEKTRLIAITHVSNVLGTVVPVEKIIERAHQDDIPVLVDGAQAVPHLPVDVSALDADFYCFSGHKLFGPTGTGVLYGKEEWLEKLPPYRGGGDMIEKVSFEKTTFNSLPYKFEAGTPNIAGAIGLGAAIHYLNQIGMEAIHNYESHLLNYATDKLKAIEGLTIYGNAPGKAGVISFLMDGIHAYDTGVVLDKLGIAVRTGHHCCQPLMAFLGVNGTVRASFAFYNIKEEIDRLAEGLLRVKKMFKK